MDLNEIQFIVVKAWVLGFLALKLGVLKGLHGWIISMDEYIQHIIFELHLN